MLLAAAVADAQQDVYKLPLMQQEATAILEHFNPPTADNVPRTLLHQLFEAQADRQPDATCIRTPQEALSYGEVEKRANGLAGVLMGKGVGADVPVGVMVERGSALYVAILAVLKAGGAYLPMDPGYPADRLQFMLEDAQAKVVITESGLQDHLDGNQTEVCFCGMLRPCTHKAPPPRPRRGLLAGFFHCVQLSR